MTDLRAKLIDEAAKALFRSGVDMELNQHPRRHAAAALDAFLDCLAENADEWAEETRVPTLVGGDALALVAALRESAHNNQEDA